jgi:hypothetical protein
MQSFCLCQLLQTPAVAWQCMPPAALPWIVALKTLQHVACLLSCSSHCLPHTPLVTPGHVAGDVGAPADCHVPQNMIRATIQKL